MDHIYDLLGDGHHSEAILAENSALTQIYQDGSTLGGNASLSYCNNTEKVDAVAGVDAWTNQCVVDDLFLQGTNLYADRMTLVPRSELTEGYSRCPSAASGNRYYDSDVYGFCSADEFFNSSLSSYDLAVGFGKEVGDTER